MSALPAAMTEQDARATIDRLAAIEPGRHWVVTCYLKLEPRHRAPRKDLVNMKNRAEEAGGGPRAAPPPPVAVTRRARSDRGEPAPGPRLSRGTEPSAAIDTRSSCNGD